MRIVHEEIKREQEIKFYLATKGVMSSEDIQEDKCLDKQGFCELLHKVSFVEQEEAESSIRSTLERCHQATKQKYDITILGIKI